MDNTERIFLHGSTELKRELQWLNLKTLLLRIKDTGSFNDLRLKEAGVEIDRLNSMDDFIRQVPFTKKEHLLADRVAHPPFGSNFTEPLHHYTRICQTSGTSTGQPMALLDTPESWEAMLNCWRQVYHAAGLKQGDRIFFAFSFGPFLGFWTAFEAATRDYMAIPGGGLSSQARLELMANYSATVLCCTPTYALRLGETIGAPSGIKPEQLKVKKLILAGEPGGCLPTTRERLSALWGGAAIFDHHGMSEVGPVSYEDKQHPASLCIMEDAYFAEVLDQNGNEVEDGEEGELVLTTLNRTACPLLRYRTGDWVCKRLEKSRLYLEGGVLGRCDDMAVIRGVNVYPSALENIVNRFNEVAEFQIELHKVQEMDEITLIVELEAGADESVVDRIQTRLRDTFALRIPVKLAPQGSLPRFEFKAKRWNRV
ncbi:MAG: hypothetical protein RL693_54 [Verrucomicrobiota bacterium]|jgi:phenylacetate-CoA ligase